MQTSFVLRSVFLASALLQVSLPALAQTPTDAGRVLQETRPPLEQVPAVTVPLIEAPAQPPPAVPTGDVRVRVTHFAFTGNSVLSEDSLRATVAPWSGRSVNFGELIQAVEAVEARYKEAGYFLAQAYLPPQKIRDGAIEIAISEGRLGETRLEGESLVTPDVLYGYLDRLPKGEALTLPVLERQILLINELAGSRTKLDLQAGDKPGTTDVVLVQQPEDLISGRLEANNHGLPSTGEKRYGITLNAGSLFNLGERISFNALTSENRNLTSYNLRGEFPIGSDGWRAMVGASRAEYSLGGAFSSLEASGTANSQRLGLAYPLVRSRAANLRLQFEADQTKLVDQFRATDQYLDKRSRGFTVAMGGDWLDDWFGGGATRAEFAWRTGELSLGETAAANDAAPVGLATAGRFDKATITAQRQQVLTREMSLQLQLTRQFAGKNLDSSEKLSLGGVGTLPGYVSGEASGDSGVLAKAAVRWQATPQLALTAFTDYAKVQLARDPLAGTTKNHKRLTDAGVSADWLVTKDFIASAVLAWAGKEAPNPADNDKPRFWFSLGYVW